MDDDGDLRNRLVSAFSWYEDDNESFADPSGWWRDGALLRDLGRALAALHDGDFTAVAGIASRGLILGTAVALHLDVGLVEIRKSRSRWVAPNKRVLRSTTPPDYNDRDLVLEVPRHALHPSDRVLLVDEWMATGAQATAARDLVEQAEARWVGAAVVVADIPADVRQRLDVRSLVRKHELPWL